MKGILNIPIVDTYLYQYHDSNPSSGTSEALNQHLVPVGKSDN